MPTFAYRGLIAKTDIQLSAESAAIKGYSEARLRAAGSAARQLHLWLCKTGLEP